MESYIQISKINDFLYSPKSLYLHGVYESFNENIYHESPQKVGRINHECIDEGKYSTSKQYLQGIPVYSEKYNIGGKIDIYDKKSKALIERKTKIKNIYQGYKFQLYAQMFCLEEIGYSIEKMCIHSLSDNKRYFIDTPDKYELQKFEKVLNDIRNYDITKKDIYDFKNLFSIYRHLDY